MSRKKNPDPDGPRYIYDEGEKPWMIDPFPTEMKDKVVAAAKAEGMTIPAYVERVFKKWFRAQDKKKK